MASLLQQSYFCFVFLHLSSLYCFQIICTSLFSTFCSLEDKSVLLELEIKIMLVYSFLMCLTIIDFSLAVFILEGISFHLFPEQHKLDPIKI